MKPKTKIISLAEGNPTLATEWNYEKNYPLTPYDISLNHRYKVWWKCKLGHEWEAIVSSRNRKGDKCPVCAGRKLLVGFNDLATTHPHLVKMWNYEKNYPLTPQMVTKGQGLKVYWTCENGHTTYNRIADKAKYGTCSMCSNLKRRSTLKDVTTSNNISVNLQTQFPVLADEWNYEKNKNLKTNRGIDISTPTKINAHSHMTVWWKCKNGHEWPDVVRNRTKAKNKGCPYCNGLVEPNLSMEHIDNMQSKIDSLKGKSLLDKHPSICKEWNYVKNLPLIPESVTEGSDTIVYWLCSKNHTYLASIRSKVKGVNCPYCNGRKRIENEN